MIGPVQTTAVASATTALIGLYVAYLAFKGYRSQGSHTMVALGIGIIAITVVPFLIAHGLTPALALSDGISILGVMIAHTVGLLAVYLTFK